MSETCCTRLAENAGCKIRQKVAICAPLYNLAAEISPVVWGTPASFIGFCILEALLHGTLVLGVSQTLRR